MTIASYKKVQTNLLFICVQIVIKIVTGRKLLARHCIHIYIIHIFVYLFSRIVDRFYSSA